MNRDRTLHYLVDAVTDYAIYMLDAEGRVSSWNTGAERLKGYTQAEIQGRHFSEFFTPEDRLDGVPDRILAKAAAEGRAETEGWRLRKDGARFWVVGAVHAVRDDQGRLIGFAKVTRDMTHQRQAQQALLESDRRFRMLVEGVIDYAIFMLDPNGIVTNWNRGAERIKGWRASEIIGQHFSSFYTEEDRASGLPGRALAMAAEHGRYEADGWRVRKDGSLFFASVVLDAIREDDGQLLGFAKITRDITERRRAQLELQRAHDRLTQAQKMEALGKLTGGVAHDFNNILMVVGGQAQLLRRKLAHDPDGLRALEAVEAAARRGEDLTRHLLSFSRRQRLTPVPLSLHDRSAALRDLLSTSLPSSVRLEFNLPDDLWPVTVDPGEFEVALLNFAVNARDAMPSGGTLRVSAENKVLDDQHELELNGEFVAVSIQDDGVGIPPDIMLKIFDPFFTTKEVNKGTGLGLSQIYGFAQQSGGRVTVSSSLGEGATFTLYLPRAGRAPEAVPQESRAISKVCAAQILLVEDNPEVADVAAGMLEELGHRVRIACNGTDALRALHDGEPVELVFSDIVMAGDIDGLDLARRIRDTAPEVPILLATGYSEAAERIGAEFPILRKPYRLPDLSHAIGTLLRGTRAPSVHRERRGRGEPLSRRRGYAEP